MGELDLFKIFRELGGTESECKICGTKSILISRGVGVCLDCMRNKPEEALVYTSMKHAESKKYYNAPNQPPKKGANCGFCVNRCRIPSGEKGYCGIVTNVEGKLERLAGTPERGILSWYYDPLPTNCVADWVCPGGTGAGYPKYAYSSGPEYGYANLAVFYGACIPENERIFVIAKGKPMVENIGTLVNGLISVSDSEKVRDFEILCPKDELMVPSLNLERLTMDYVPISRMSRRRYKGSILTIKLETGRRFSVTRDHPLIVFRDGGFLTIPATDLKKGDFIPIAKRIPRIKEGLDEIDLIDEITKKGFDHSIMVHGAKNLLYGKETYRKLKQIVGKKYLIDNWRKSDSMPLWVFNLLDNGVDRRSLKIGIRYARIENLLPAIIPISIGLARLIGYYLSEGYGSGGRVSFCVGISEKDLAKEIEDLLGEIFGTSARTKIRKWKGKESAIVVDARSKTLELIFLKVFEMGSNSYNKKIPCFAFSARESFIKEVIFTYLLGDGHLRRSESSKRPRNSFILMFGTASSQLFHGIMILMLRLGIQLTSIGVNIGVNSSIFEGKIQGGTNYAKLWDCFEELFTRRGFNKLNPTPRAGVPIVDTYPVSLFNQSLPLKTWSKRVSLQRLLRNYDTLPFEVRHIINSDILLIRVKDIWKESCDGYVYDLELKVDPYHNFMLASGIIIHNCSFDCLFCQNWHFRENTKELKPLMSSEELARKAKDNVSCICFFGGDPTPQMPHALETAKIATGKAAEEERIFRVCWETNGSMNWSLARKAMELSLRSGGCMKFDLKCFDENLNTALCGVSNEYTLQNFRRLGQMIDGRPDPPPLVASTLLIPGYIDKDEVQKIATFIAGIDPDIPYALLGFFPHYFMRDLPATSKNHAHECLEAAKEAGLKKVRIGNVHLLSSAY